MRPRVYREGKDLFMRVLLVAAIVFAMSGWSLAQDQGNVEELNRKYQDALAQLKAAQDRKNELATENDKLNAHVADMQKQLDELHRQAATFAQQTFDLRSEHAAWQSFLKRYPRLAEEWKLFIESDPLAAPSTLPTLIDPRSPLLME
jgi:septal ring factor EnvC (AmiA/AmiB activator)